MNKEWKNIEIKGLEDGDLWKYSIKKLGCIEGGKTQGKINAENGHVKIAAGIGGKKQWKEDRETQLKKCVKGGKTAVKQKKGCHSLSQKQLSNAGKKGYSNGLGKLSKQKKKKIASKAGLAGREVNSKFTKEDVIFMRKNFIPRHPQFGVVAFAKKYNTEECTVRNAIKGRTFKDIK
jgi:hypothetical protein